MKSNKKLVLSVNIVLFITMCIHIAIRYKMLLNKAQAVPPTYSFLLVIPYFISGLIITIILIKTHKK